jgi:aerobic-type carbon monoxide dehydrogenase small subunit (CoxS/CutS family)
MPLTLTVNGDAHQVLAEPHRTLLEVLRTDLGLTGTKENCLEAECGVCTVLLDGAAVNACILLAAQCQGRSIVTIEGLAAPGDMHPLQRAFIDHGAVQCGYCIPGMILSAKAYLDDNPEPSEDQVRQALAGNLCRCTGYQKITEAVMSAARTCRGAPRVPRGALSVGGLGAITGASARLSGPPA